MNIRDYVYITKFKIKDLVPELLWSFSTLIIISYLNYFLGLSGFEILNYFGFIPISPQLLLIVVWIIIYLLTFPVIESVLQSIKRGSRYDFDISDWPKMWIFHGGIEVCTNPDSLLIKQSASGCLLTKYIWKDFQITFLMKYDTQESKLDHKSVGILFRALNLESYYMFEMQTDKKTGELFVKPHVRLLGTWEYVDWVSVGIYDTESVFKIKLRCKGRKVKFYINGLFKYQWMLPDKIDFRGARQPDHDTEKIEDYATYKSVLDIPFLNKYGMIGFRADWGQGALITDLQIKKV